MPTLGSESNTLSKMQEAVLRVRDLTMLQAHNNNERELEDWERLFDAADKGLQLRKVVEPFHSLMAVLELSYEPQGALASSREIEEDGQSDLKAAKRHRIS